jgi:hypothetical protein
MSSEKLSLDEYPIQELPNTPQWTENYAFLGGDPDTRSALYCSWGRWIGDPTLWREVIGVILPDQTIVLAKNYGRNFTPTAAGASVSSWEVIEPAKKLRFRFDGPVVQTTHDPLFAQGYREGPKKRCRIDLTFDGVGPVWNMDGKSQEASRIAGSLHIEQVGHVNGTIEFDGQTHRWKDAYGIRDHSRGPRDLKEYRWSCWINGHLPGNRVFHMYAMQLQGKNEIGMQNAGIFDKGQYYPAKIVRTDLLEDTLNPKARHMFVLESELGSMEIRTADPLTAFPTSMFMPYDMCPGWMHHPSAAHLIDQLVWFECDGQRTLGWSERGLAAQRLV